MLSAYIWKICQSWLTFILKNVILVNKSTVDFRSCNLVASEAGKLFWKKTNHMVKIFFFHTLLTNSAYCYYFSYFSQKTFHTNFLLTEETNCTKSHTIFLKKKKKKCKIFQNIDCFNFLAKLLSTKDRRFDDFQSLGQFILTFHNCVCVWGGGGGGGG